MSNSTFFRGAVMTEEEKTKALMPYFSRGIVSLGWFDQTGPRADENEGNGRLFTVSAFVVSVQGIWFLMTAGHVIDGIEQAIAAGQKLTSFHIDDNWSGRKVPDNTFAFDYARSNKFFINDPKSQADYGAIWLTDYTRTMLEGRIQPFDETDWRMLPNDFDQFERYVICGFPAQLLSNKVVDECVHSTKGLAIFELDKVDPPTHIKSSFPRFYGSRQ